MKFICETGKFAKALRDMTPIIRRVVEPMILNNVLIEAEGEHVRITATNLDTIYTRTISASILEPGRITISQARLQPIMSALPDGSQIDFALAGDRVEIKSGKSKYRFDALKADGFPPMPFKEGGASFDFDGSFLQSLDRARHAAFENGAVIEIPLQGALLRRVGDKIHLASTDRTRLSRWEIDAIDGSEGMDLSLPTGAIDMILKMAPEGARLECDDSKIRVKIGDDILIAKVLDQSYFPSNYVTLIESSTAAATEKALIDTDELDAALSRIQIVNDDKEKLVRLTFNGDGLSITPVRRSGIDGDEEIAYEGGAKEVSVALKSNLVRDALKAVDSDTIQIAVSAPQAPIIITSPTKPEALVIVMTAAA